MPTTSNFSRTAGFALLSSLLFVLFPVITHALVVPNPFLGGGTLSRTAGVSHFNLGLRDASRDNSTSQNSQSQNSGGQGGEQSNAEHGTESGGQSEANSVNAGAGSGNNGGTTAGNGGAGGAASPGGSVRAGDTVSNSSAFNAINTTIVRFSTR